MGVFSTIKNNALSIARFVLPKKLEERFGIVKETPFQIKIGEGLSPQQARESEKIIAGQSPIIQKQKREAVKKVEPEIRTKVVQEIQRNTSEELKQEVKNSITRDINSGILEKDDIRRNVKNLIEQRVNERILQMAIGKPPIWTFDEVKRDPIGWSKAVFDKDWKRNTEEIVNGIGVLLGMGLRRVKNQIVHPIETFKNDIDTTQQLITSPAYRQEVYNTYLKPIVEEYKEYRHPFQKLAEDPVDVVLDATAILSLVGQGTKLIGFTKVGKKITQASQVFSLKNISNTTKSVINKMPGGEQIIKDLELASETRKILTKEQTAFLIARDRIINDINQKVNKLSKAETQVLPQVVEGFALAPNGASKEFYEALGLMRSLAKDQERFGLKIGALTSEVIERRRFQPLAKWLEKEGKLETKIPFEELTGNQLRGTIDTIKKFFPESDPIYMRHFFNDTPKNFKNFFLNTSPVRTFKPGFLKKSFGKDGYIGQSAVTKKQLKEVLEKQATENLKWQKNIQLLERIKNNPNVKPLKPGEDLLPGHKVFAPDGMIRFYKGTINLVDELKKKTDLKKEVWDIFEDAIESSFPKTKEFIGVGKAKLFQVPEAMANQLSKLAKSTNPWIKLIYDKPMDAFRFSVLGLMPRWLFNNIIGNSIFSIISGDIFNPKAFYHAFQARKAGLLPDDLFGGLHRVERTTSGKLGTAADLPLVKSTIALHDKILDTRVIGQLVKAAEVTVSTAFKPLLKIGDLSFKNNKFVDDMFKGVGFINRALKEQRKNFLNRTVISWNETRKILEGIKPASTEKIIQNVHDWYYHGLNLTNFERRVIRRVIPFYSWMRWASLYSMKIATEAPVRANIIKNMARDFYTFTGQDKLPDWMRGSIPIGTDQDGTVYYLKTKGANPFSHLNDFMSDGILGVILQSAAPPIKTFYEQATGREIFLGKKFTKEDITETFNGQLFKFDPELGQVVEVNETIKPGIIENLLRNYIPQYLLMEVALTGGKQRYTAEGLNTILSDLFKNEQERKSIVKDIITKQGETKKKFWNEIGKVIGINIQEVKPEQQRARQQNLERATSAIKNKELPILNPQFKNLIKERILQEIAEGTPVNEITQKVKEWIGVNVEELKKLKPSAL